MSAWRLLTHTKTRAIVRWHRQHIIERSTASPARRVSRRPDRHPQEDDGGSHEIVRSVYPWLHLNRVPRSESGSRGRAMEPEDMADPRTRRLLPRRCGRPTLRVFADGGGAPTDLPSLLPRTRPRGLQRHPPIREGRWGQVYEGGVRQRTPRAVRSRRGLGTTSGRDCFWEGSSPRRSASQCVYVSARAEVRVPGSRMELAPAGTLKDLMGPGDAMPISRRPSTRSSG